jgi:nucleotide-binding universal stress UspA family protein
VVEFKQVLCPIDLSGLSIRSLAYAGAIAKLYDGELTALHVVPTFEPMEVRAGALYDPVRIVYPMSRGRCSSGSGRRWRRPAPQLLTSPSSPKPARRQQPSWIRL